MSLPLITYAKSAHYAILLPIDGRNILLVFWFIYSNNTNTELKHTVQCLAF